MRIAMTLAAALLTLSVGQARATQIYRFITTTSLAPAGTQSSTLSLTIALNDAVVSKGSFQLTAQDAVGPSRPAPILTGDADLFQLFVARIPNGDSTMVSQGYDIGTSLSIDLTVDMTTGDLLTDRISFLGHSIQGNLSGTGSMTSGRIGSDSTAACFNGCDITGYFVHELPEPASTAVLASALGAVGFLRRRRKFGA